MRKNKRFPSFDDPRLDPSLITPMWLMEQHHGLTEDEAELLLLFCWSYTIRFKECYGDGSIMFPLWCGVMDNLGKQIKVALDQ